jgi:hypothetical protein
MPEPNAYALACDWRRACTAIRQSQPDGTVSGHITATFTWSHPDATKKLIDDAHENDDTPPPFPPPSEADDDDKLDDGYL